VILFTLKKPSLCLLDINLEIKHAMKQITKPKLKRAELHKLMYQLIALNCKQGSIHIHHIESIRTH
jgi:hypothetical protein